MNATRKLCPKCGYERTAEDDQTTPPEQCPNCGVIYEKALRAKSSPAGKRESGPITQAVASILMVVVFVIAAASLFSDDGADATTLPTSSAGFDEVDDEVGCGSDYSDEKRADIFRARYQDHWMTWPGTVVSSDNGEVDIDAGALGMSDLDVELSDPDEGYDLIDGEEVVIRFVMRKPGGCFIPFRGDMASIQ